MQKVLNNRPPAFFEILFLVYVAAFFLTLGGDYAGQLNLRMGFGAILLTSSVFFLKRFYAQGTIARFSVFFFGLFVAFEIGRALWAGWSFVVLGVPDTLQNPLLAYLKSPLRWSFYLGFFIMSLSLVRRKPSAFRFLNVTAWSSFFIAINGLPALIRGNLGGYTAHGGRMTFF